VTAVAGHLAALVLLVALLLAWVAVQRAWARTFPGDGSDPDGLAERMGCSGTACREPCARARCARSAGEEESA
jgi:hypothetical protein